jgi:hypothetical protein
VDPLKANIPGLPGLTRACGTLNPKPHTHTLSLSLSLSQLYNTFEYFSFFAKEKEKY